MTSRNRTAFTLVELLVVLVFILLVVALIGRPLPTSALVKGQVVQTLSNMRQLHLATQQMALDGVTTADTNFGWPGDIGGSFTNWTSQLLKGDYLSTNDLYKLLSAPGVVVKPDDVLTASNTALVAYTVFTNSPATDVFLSTANFTNTATGGILNPSAKPYGNKQFVVFRRLGDGAILQSRQVGMTNLIGTFAPLCH